MLPWFMFEYAAKIIKRGEKEGKCEVVSGVKW
jgi:hypothetical protein